MLDLPELTALAESDIHWDKIVKIEPIGERDVYDATVLETHNFTANGLTLHNSLEQDSDSVLFLYRDSVYNPAAPEDEAEILLAKNRQGVSGVIVPTKWEGKAVRFRDTKADYTRGAAGGLSTAPKADGSWF
jgi:replicative DNA helicase